MMQGPRFGSLEVDRARIVGPAPDYDYRQIELLPYVRLMIGPVHTDLDRDEVNALIAELIRLREQLPEPRETPEC